MGTNQGDTLNWDSDNKKTSGYKGDPGDGSSSWYLVAKIAGFLRTIGDAYAATHKGSLALVVRRDTAVADEAVAEYQMLHVDASGRLQVAALGTIPGIPLGATPVVAESGIVANAVATATLAAAASVTNYLTGFVVTAAGSTAGLAVELTITNIIGAVTPSFAFVAPAGVLVPAPPLIVTFPSPVPASAANTAIAVSLPALGAGNTHAAVVAFGFRI